MAIQPPLRLAHLHQAALYTNGYYRFVPWQQACAFQVHGRRALGQYGIESPAFHFLVNTMHDKYDAQTDYTILSYLDDRGLIMVSRNGHENTDANKVLSLPKSMPLDLRLGEVMMRRRSQRNFTGDPIRSDFLASILRAGSGVSARQTVRLMQEGEVVLALRTVPSAGGLYPIEIYIICLHIDGIPRGVYRYQAIQDVLVRVAEADDVERIMVALTMTGQEVSTRYASAILLMVARPWKTMRKYGDRGLRFVMHEAGAMSQQVHLAVTCLGLGSVDCAHLNEHDIHACLGFDGVYECVLHAIMVGSIVS